MRTAFVAKEHTGVQALALPTSLPLSLPPFPPIQPLSLSPPFEVETSEGMGGGSEMCDGFERQREGGRGGESTGGGGRGRERAGRSGGGRGGGKRGGGKGGGGKRGGLRDRRTGGEGG
eukprot:2510820-Rhodomonas_salina.1